MQHCIVCGEKNIEIHHTLFGKNRKKATEDGLVVPLCYEHHRGKNGVHGLNKELDIKLKQLSEQKWCEYYDKTIEEWLERYNRNYL